VISALGFSLSQLTLTSERLWPTSRRSEIVGWHFHDVEASEVEVYNKVSALFLGWLYDRAIRLRSQNEMQWGIKLTYTV
jgi:hypothetical protein